MLGQSLLDRFVRIVLGKIIKFMWIELGIIKLFRSVPVSDINTALVSYGMVLVTHSCQSNTIPLRIGIFQQRPNVVPIDVLGNGQSYQITKRGVDAL